MNQIVPALIVVLSLSLAACSEPTPESRAQAEAAFPQPDENILTADIPKETPPAAKEVMRKMREGSAEFAADAKAQGAELLDKAREAIHEATAKSE
ncbi:MAG: hypothetical protein H6981_07875 [Gammaproteobacteria bacterium]|nr:hypothetical protein [Gammaproteobacteria bacterium]MCP5136702.1 hypothetical protein [Gammaproteobacteria bacterium]